MTKQIRNWEETLIEKTGQRQWKLFINENPVPDGYILELSENEFELHYPHLKPRVCETLIEAKHRLEAAPPITKGELPIRRKADEASEDLITVAEAGELLGKSRYRINAMVVNGALVAQKIDGELFISRKSVETILARRDAAGPSGRFANLFVSYLPNGKEHEFTIYEIDHENNEHVTYAQCFVERMNDETVIGIARILDYRAAMMLCSYARRALDQKIEHGSSIEPLGFDELVAHGEEHLARRIKSNVSH